MQMFYCKDITSGYATLNAEESHHAVRVLRMREGDEIHVTDGQGNLCRCLIVEADSRACGLQVVECASGADACRPSLCLAVAPTKNPSRMEWLVEKAVEVGVSSIVLLQCSHSERTFMKTDRLQKVALSAMKQSLHTVLPVIQSPVVLTDWLRSREPLPTEQLFIAHCAEGEPRIPLVAALRRGVAATVLIGPEGDFAPEEVAMAREHGFVPVSLGPSRLRTETAAIYAAVAMSMAQDIDKQ